MGHISGNFQNSIICRQNNANLLPSIDSHLRNRTIFKWPAFYESKFKNVLSYLQIEKKMHKMCPKCQIIETIFFSTNLNA